MEQAHQLNPEEESIRVQLGVAYCQRGDCASARPFLEGAQGYPGISSADYEALRSCKTKCGAE
jgi:hypothetical protein